MTKVQGEFAFAAEGHKAVEALIAAGVPRERIRVWNVIPDASSAQLSGSATLGGAITGLVLGGVPGLAAGAAIGSVFDSGSEDRRLPLPSGVRVVVDVPDSDGAVRDILTSCGAANIGTMS